VREEPTTRRRDITREQLIEALNAEAEAGMLVVFLLKTGSLVKATGASANGNTVQVTVEESPASILGKTAAGRAKSYSKAEIARRKVRLAKGREQRWK